MKIEDYYQEVSKEDLVGLIKDWTDLLNDTSLKIYLMKEEAKKDIPKSLLRKNDEDKPSIIVQDGNEYEKVDATTFAMGKLIMTTWIYGKKKTSKLLANYQHNFKGTPKKTLKFIDTTQKV